MRPFFLFWLLLTFSFNSQANDSSNDKQLVFAAADWCPYTCGYSKHPGFVSEWLISVLQAEDWKVSIQVLPWRQALELSKAGKVDGLVTATQVEAPHMLFTDTPIDNQRSCFFVKQDRAWQYQNLESLSGIRLGLIENYAYGSPVDRWLAKQAGSAMLFRSQAQHPLEELLGKAKRNEIDIFIEDAYVLRHHLYQHPKPNLKLRQAGCLDENPFYIAINPDRPHSQKLVSQLNSALKDSNKQVLKEYIKYRYGLLKNSQTQ